MEKSADAFRTISEVAEDLVLPQHVLRFWEQRFPQIRPLKRAGGRRYYRPADVTLLRAIRQLLYDDGYTIKGVQRLLKEQGARGLRGGGEAGAAPDAEARDDPELDALAEAVPLPPQTARRRRRTPTACARRSRASRNASASCWPCATPAAETLCRGRTPRL